MSDLKNTKKFPPNPLHFKTDINREIDSLEPISELKKISDSIMYKDQKESEYRYPINEFRPIDYLRYIQSRIPKRFISKENYDNICQLASFFDQKISTFFGFETRLNTNNPYSDYLFAVSRYNGEKEALNMLLHSSDFESMMNNSVEWTNIKKFTQKWCDKHSILNKNIYGLWFEFDMDQDPNGLPIPSVFINTIPINNDFSVDDERYQWLTETAIPLLIGEKLSKRIEENLVKCIQMLPDGTSLIDVGFMLSRSSSNVRLMLNKMKPNDIIPYLKSIHWKGDIEKLQSLILELKKFVNRITLHFGINEQINSNIGIECSIKSDTFDIGNRWSKFLDYLAEKGLCTIEKKEKVLNFIGSDLDQGESEFNYNSFSPIVKTEEKCTSKVLIRYISHIKISYSTEGKMKAKAYPGVRLFGKN